MRVATKTIYESVKYNLNNIAEELNKTSEIVSSGKKITDISDDPVGLSQALDIRSTLSNIAQLKSNIDLAESWLNSAESALSSVQDLISDAKALCVEMATATTGESERESAATTMQNTIDEIISLANTEVGDRYIFAGSDTDSTPFSEDGSYNGNSNPFTVNIGKDTTLAIGSDGGVVFEGIFETLSDLKNALENNNVGGIEEAMDSLDEHFDQITAKISDVGSKLNRTETKKTMLSNLDLTNTERLSSIEDADVAEAIIDLEEIELVYEAALSASTKVMKLSLVDYLD